MELLGEDPRGAFYGGYLFPVEYAMQLVPALRAGRLGSSFRFRVVREDFEARPPKSPHNPERLPERTIGETHVSEFGPVVPGLLEHVSRRQDVIAGRRDSIAARHERGVPPRAPAATVMAWSGRPPTEWAHWQTAVAAGQPYDGVQRPCGDCPAAWRAAMAADGRCNGGPGTEPVASATPLGGEEGRAVDSTRGYAG